MTKRASRAARKKQKAKERNVDDLSDNSTPFSGIDRAPCLYDPIKNPNPSCRCVSYRKIYVSPDRAWWHQHYGTLSAHGNSHRLDENRTQAFLVCRECQKVYTWIQPSDFWHGFELPKPPVCPDNDPSQRMMASRDDVIVGKVIETLEITVVRKSYQARPTNFTYDFSEVGSRAVFAWNCFKVCVVHQALADHDTPYHATMNFWYDIWEQEHG
jgi:hypothetical protein